MGVEGTTLLFDILARMTGNGFKDLAREADKAEDALDDLNDTNKKLTDLRPGALDGLRGALRQVEGDARKAQDALNRISPPGDIGGGDQAGHNFGVRFGAAITRGIAGALVDGSGMIGHALARMGPQAQAGIAAIGVAAMSGIGAALNGALLAALSSGSVAAGVMVAVRDAQVKQAGKELGQTLLSGLSTAARDSFVPATIDAIGTVRAEFASMGRDLRSFFAQSAPFLDPLVRGLTGMVRQMLPGLTEALRNSGPVVLALSDGFAQLGKTVGDAFAMMSQASIGAGQGLRDFFTILNFGVKSAATGITGLSYAWTFLRNALNPAGGIREVIDQQYRGAAAADTHRIAALAQAQAFQSLTAGYARSGMAAATSATQIQAYNDAVAAGRTDTLNAAQAALNMQQSYANLTTTIKNNNKTARESKQEYFENQQALLQFASSVHNAASAMARQTGSQETANQVLEAGRQKFIAAGRAAGYDAGQVQNLANKLFGIPKNPKSKVTVNKQQAERDLAVFSAKAAAATRTRYMSIIVHYNSPSQSGALGAVGQIPRASGGPTLPGRTYLVGEKGPELIRMGSTSGHVTPNHRLGRSATASGTPSAGGVSGGGDDMARAVAKALSGMAVVLDGRKVGEIQGRTANLYARGG